MVPCTGWAVAPALQVGALASYDPSTDANGGDAVEEADGDNDDDEILEDEEEEVEEEEEEGAQDEEADGDEGQAP